MGPAEVLATWFPDAAGGLLTGSLARGEETATSDMDLLVLLPGRPAPMRRTERVGGRLVEFFVHTEESFVAFGLRNGARVRWEAGPAELTGVALEDCRYRLTGLLDDLADEQPGAAVAVLATTVFLDVADLALALRGRWSGRGRWLARRLREADEALGEALVAGLAGDGAALVRCGRAELARAGGRLDDGYVRYA